MQWMGHAKGKYYPKDKVQLFLATLLGSKKWIVLEQQHRQTLNGRPVLPSAHSVQLPLLLFCTRNRNGRQWLTSRCFTATAERSIFDIPVIQPRIIGLCPKTLPIFTITFGPSVQIAVRSLFNLTFKSLHTFSINLPPFFLGKILWFW